MNVSGIAFPGVQSGDCEQGFQTNFAIVFFRLPQMLERCPDPQPMKTGTRRRESKNLFFLLSQIFQFLFLLLFSLKIYVLLKFINAINAMALCASIKDEIMSHYLLCISPLSYDHILIIR